MIAVASPCALTHGEVAERHSLTALKTRRATSPLLRDREET